VKPQLSTLAAAGIIKVATELRRRHFSTARLRACRRRPWQAGIAECNWEYYPFWPAAAQEPAAVELQGRLEL